MWKFLPVALFLSLIGWVACGGGESRAPAIGEAYAGPANLSLRKDIPLQSPVVAAAKHGEQLEIVRRRRRFVLVRTARGVEGWTEDYLLLSADEITALQDVERRARQMPSQGAASTYEMLNVHTQPNRFSPSFLQIKKGEKVDVVAHVSAPRTAPPRKPLIPPRPKAAALVRKRPEPRIPLPPMPSPPSPPANWIELSKTPPEVQQQIDASHPAAQPVPQDDWSLVRNAAGESGWVLTRRLFMAIPDEVAQYAEGHRITSYFSLGDVRDGGEVKHEWLWTTIGGGDHQYDFDSFRIFTWSLRRHRYETAYIQRNVEGYFPVLVRPGGFSLCLASSGGGRVRRSYTFAANMVRASGQQPCEAAENVLGSPSTSGPGSRTPAAPVGNRSLYARLKAIARRWFRH
ncbi:MAG TPA: hypothetical protein VMI94_21230 [Bryobacteraceae bacterium]|nr:hypothetical protein [Bryobacteraceae bacterium]